MNLFLHKNEGQKFRSTEPMEMLGGHGSPTTFSLVHCMWTESRIPKASWLARPALNEKIQDQLRNSAPYIRCRAVEEGTQHHPRASTCTHTYVHTCPHSCEHTYTNITDIHIHAKTFQMLRSKSLNELKSLFNFKSREGKNGELESMANTKQLPEIKLIKARKQRSSGTCSTKQIHIQSRSLK